MKKMLRLVCVLLAVCLIVTLPETVFAAPQEVTVVLDGETLSFSGAVPYYDGNEDRIFVPVRVLVEALGAKVDEKISAQTLTITAADLSVKLTIDSKIADVNGAEVTLDAAPFLRDDVTFLPLYILANLFHLGTQWNADTMTVRIHSGAAVSLSQESSQVTEILGEPTRKAVSEKGYTWLVYCNLADYRMIGVEDEKVVAYYLHSVNWQDASGISSGMSAEECTAALKGYTAQEYGAYTVYTASKDIFTLFFDETGNVYAIQHELAEYADTLRISAAVLEGFAYQLQDLINVERTRRGCSVLVWDNSIADIAGTHASDLAKNNTYSHEGSDNSTPSQRLRDAGFEDFYEIEIIARAYPNALTAFAAHLNSPQYLAALEAGYTSMGAAAAYNPQSDGILYYTQVFYAAK